MCRRSPLWGDGADVLLPRGECGLAAYNACTRQLLSATTNTGKLLLQCRILCGARRAALLQRRAHTLLGDRLRKRKAGMLCGLLAAPAGSSGRLKLTCADTWQGHPVSFISQHKPVCCLQACHELASHPAASWGCGPPRARRMPHQAPAQLQQQQEPSWRLLLLGWKASAGWSAHAI